MSKDPPRWLIVAAIVALLAFVIIAASLAFSTFRQRSAPPSQVWTPLPPRAVLTGAPVTRLTSAPAATASATMTAAAAPATATPTPAPSTSTHTAQPPAPGTETPAIAPVTATPALSLTATAAVTAAATAAATTPATVAATATPCAVPLALELAGLYSPAVFGCPTGDTAVVWAAWEPFQRGAMLWRADTDTSYAFLTDGRWRPIEARWGGEPPPGRGTPPAGLLAPERGFGWAWGTNNTLFNDLGWATDVEKGFCAQVQPFERGFLLRSNAAATCTSENLYNHATSPAWQPIALAVYEEGWSGTRPPDVVLPADIPSRPAEQGLFPAPRLAAIELDGWPDEWPGPWLPLTTIVEGAAAWTGTGDLSGAFQVAWDDRGLYLAAVVIDDRYQPGPAGADLWKGDSLEVNFDRDLAADFEGTESNDDDYQVGLSYGPELALMLGYRWLPSVLEGPLDVLGAAVTTAAGYTIEASIPWEVFDLTLAELAPGATFGFNVALNDNDSDGPAQETVASASPARTTYDNPVQWGTLVLK